MDDEVVMGIALLGGLIGMARADVKCPPGHKDECGARKAFYCVYLDKNGVPHSVYMGYKCWCGEGRSCYPCVPVPDCSGVSPNAIGIFIPPW